MSRHSALLAIASALLLALAGPLEAQAPQQDPVSFDFDGGFALH